MAGTTLKQVAARAGVSHQTVSNVLNGVSVRPETLDRVHTAIRELGYQPNFTAKALRAARSMTITLAFFEHDSQEIADPYRSLLQAAVLHEATQLGYSLLNTFVYRTGPSTLTTLQHHHLQKRTDGTILVGLRDDPAQLQQLTDANMPVVLLDYCGPTTNFPTVTAQYAEGMRQLVEHVVRQGRRNLALVIANDDITTRIEREQSFLTTTRELNVHATVCHGDWSYSSGERAFHQLWSGETRPDAILAANDRMAIGCLAAARELGVRVPQDVSVSGFDDFKFSCYAVPSLTTVRVPYAQMAHEALRQLVHAIQSSTHTGGVQRLPVTLIPRQSA